MKKNITKAVLFVIASVLIVATLLTTYNLSNTIQKREMNILDLYANIYEYYFKPTNDIDLESSQNSDILLLLINDITPKIDNPFIFTDENDVPLEPYDIWSVNVGLEKVKEKDQKQYMIDYVAKMKRTYEPFLVKDGASDSAKVIQKLYYYHSSLVDRLRWFPLAALVIILGIIWIGYFAFSYFRKNTESLVWVGMAKEAAHQLGTPLSSLMAWIEIIKYGKDDPEQIEMTTIEMAKDIDRLNTIAKRFSKIGSKPELEIANVTEVLENICRYFEMRLPHLGRKIEIIRKLDKAVDIPINIELFAWVIENLLKNAAEAIEDVNGTVTIVMDSTIKNKLMIYIKDSGKGMSKANKNKVFNAGFTTKKRGWGLGLTLTKRIIEEYHDGKIFIKETAIGKGTTFAIELPNSDRTSK
ncbi:MAG: HAMP domain-containing sensor histidine kinase [bacterium]